jgi:hypothetical protein
VFITLPPLSCYIKLRFERNFRHGDAGFCALGRWASSGVALTQTKTHKEEDYE